MEPWHTDKSAEEILADFETILNLAVENTKKCYTERLPDLFEQILLQKISEETNHDGTTAN